MKKILLKKIPFLSNGKVVKRDDLSKYAWLTVGYGPDYETGQAFESREAFVNWSQGTEHEARVARIFQIIDDSGRYSDADHSQLIERQQKLIERIKAELIDLSHRTGIEIGSERMLLTASGRADILEGRIFDSALLFENSNMNQDRAGRWLPIPSGWWFPDFGWFGFNDIASSGSVFGDLILCEHTWYRGVGIDFRSGAFPPISYDAIQFELGGWWNDRVSSGFSIWW